MPKIYGAKGQAELWRSFFLEEQVAPLIRETVTDWPDTCSLEIGFADLANFNHEFAAHVLTEPITSLEYADIALNELARAYDSTVNLKFRITEFPASSRIQIRDLRSHHVSHLIAIRGLLRKVTQVRSKLHVGAFKCVCGHTQRLRQYGEELSEPFECPENEGGCGRKSGSTKFTLIFDQSFFIDAQKVELQESPERLRGGTQPQRIVCFIEKDITGRVFPGEDVTLNGVLVALERRKGFLKKTTFDHALAVLSIEKDDEDEDLEISPNDLEEIRKLSLDAEIYEKFRNSVAPAIYGMDHIKDALVLQLFGGVRKTVKGTTIRGDIHILLIGDPGTAKSQLLRYVCALSPRGIFASGQAATKAGLIAAAVPDDFDDKRWTLEAGALVLANNGTACIDELDKMNKDDRSAMHEALEQQVASIAKAGITATLRCQCSLLAAANPRAGRFDPFRSIFEEINLPPTLLTRFDAIFPIIDKPVREKDTALISHILGIHLEGEILEFTRHNEDQEPPSPLELGNPKEPPRIDRDLLRKYIAHAKRTVFPVLTKDAADYIKAYYVRIRNEKARADEVTKVPITPRQAEAFIRLAEASARVRLSSRIERQDVMRAAHIIKSYIEGITHEEGFDMDAIEIGATHTQQQRIHILVELIETLCNDRGQQKIRTADIIDACKQLDPPIQEKDVRATLRFMKSQNITFGYRGYHAIMRR